MLRYSGTTGAFLGTFVTAGSGGLSNPRSLTYGPDGNLYVSSSGSNAVLRYDGSTGASLGTFIPAGSGGLSNPGDLLFSGGRLYVASQNTNQVLRYDAATGAFLDDAVPANNGGLDRPLGLLMEPVGNLVVGGFADVIRYAAPFPALFTVRLNHAVPTTVTVGYATTAGTAQAGSDFTAVSGALTFAPGETNKTIIVPIVDDAVFEGDEAFTVTLSEAVGATILDGQGEATILDNDFTTTTFAKTENKTIPDLGTYTSSLAVTPTGTILDLNIRVNIQHDWDEDLDVTLIAPDGTRIELFTDVGGAGSNFTNTVLDDDATTLMINGTAPFTGTYKPEGNLTVLEGKTLAGTWKLEAKDDTRLLAGKLIDWAIIARYLPSATPPQVVVTPTSGLVTTESGGTASFTVLLSKAPSANVTIPVSSSNPAEGNTSVSVLTFTPANWNVAQTVVVTGVDDAIVDGPVAYSIVLGNTTSTDPAYNGLDPADVSVTNTDNDVMPTKFYVVNDASTDRTYEYAAGGGAIEDYALNSGNTAPRGAASTAAGDKVWVVDANKKVYVYNTAGGLLGSWTAGSLASNATVEGIATNGVDVDRRCAAGQGLPLPARHALSGSQNAASSFSLNSSNTSPKDVATDGSSLWVVNDSSTDKVFKYNSVSGTFLGSWTITAAGPSPTGSRSTPRRVSAL
ncbi:MAG: Calx-beta domain-containing protein [Isosphaeraceae bacterium]